MASNMKAVITLTADASGVQAGVNQALRQLDRMQQGISTLRGLAVAGLAMDLGRMMFSGIQEQMQRISDAAHQYSPDAMGASNQLAITQMQQDKRLAEAFGPFIALIDQIKGQALIELTSYLIANKDAIGEALVNIATFGIALGQLAGEGLVYLSERINELATFLSEFMADPMGKTGDVASAVGQTLLDLNPITLGVRLIADKMGGD